MSEQYGCPDCNYVEYIDKIPIQCPICGHTSMERLRWTKGGDGSHWEGCAEAHWDCRIAQLEAELAALKAERRWIPVSEKPTKSDWYLIMYQGYGVPVAGYYHVDGGWLSDIPDCWMPLPEPPEVEECVKSGAKTSHRADDLGLVEECER